MEIPGKCILIEKTKVIYISAISFISCVSSVASVTLRDAERSGTKILHL